MILFQSKLNMDGMWTFCYTVNPWLVRNWGSCWSKNCANCNLLWCVPVTPPETPSSPLWRSNNERAWLVSEYGRDVHLSPVRESNPITAFSTPRSEMYSRILSGWRPCSYTSVLTTNYYCFERKSYAYWIPGNADTLYKCLYDIYIIYFSLLYSHINSRTGQ